MKKILFAITAFSMIGFNVLCQEAIVPLGTEEEMEEVLVTLRPITTGLYIKDINGVLDKYAGFWRAELEGKEYIIEFYKNTYIDNDYKKDELNMKLQTKDLNTNEIVYSDFQNPLETPIATGIDYGPFFIPDDPNSFTGDLYVYRLYTYRNSANYYIYLLLPERDNPNKLNFFLYRHQEIYYPGTSTHTIEFEDLIPGGKDITFERIENPFEE